MNPTETKSGQDPASKPSGGHSRGLMIACGVVIAAIAVFVVAAGAPLASLVLVIACMAMLGFMMLMMMRG